MAHQYQTYYCHWHLQIAYPFNISNNRNTIINWARILCGAVTLQIPLTVAQFDVILPPSVTKLTTVPSGTVLPTLSTIRIVTVAVSPSTPLAKVFLLRETLIPFWVTRPVATETFLESA